MIETLNNIAGKWFAWELAILWQVAVLIAIVWVIDLLIKKWAWPQMRYALWLLVLVKLVLPPTLVSPTSFTAQIPFVVQEAVKIQITKPQPLETTESIAAVSPVENPQHYTQAPTDSAHTDITAQPAEITPALTALSWRAYAFIVWLGGIVILSFWLIIRLSNLRREHLKGRQQSHLPDRLNQLLNATAQRLKLKKVPQLILTDKVCCPAVFGVFHPVLLMPADKLKNLTRGDTEHILFHELAHIKRGDLFIHAIYMILQIAYWFNPLLWLIRKQLQNLRELCCDATVAKILKEKTSGYRDTLLETARQLLAEPVDPGLGLLGLFENSNRLIDRLKWLEKKTWKNQPLRIFTIIALVCLMTTSVLPMAKAGKNNKATEGTETTENSEPVLSKAEGFTATLPNGVTVELVGVCKYDGESKGWLKPDGTVFTPDLYVQRREEYKGQNRLAFVVKLNTEDFNLEFNIKDVESYSGMDLYGTSDNVLHNYKAAVALVENDNDITDLRIGVATEPWQTITQFRADKRDVSGPKEIIFSFPIESKNGTAISVRGDWDRNLGERRVIAIDKQGKTHIGSWSGHSSWDKTISMSEFKKILPKQIEKYELQFRPYKWVEFKNVSLKPNFKTDVQIEVGEKSTGWIEYSIDFEITKQGFLENDWIEITEILGSSSKIETGQTYTIKGKYKLASHDQAMLHIYATNGQTRSVQGPVLKRGTGDFTRTFTYQEDGWLHLSFYPAEGGSSFGNLYFAEKGFNQQVPDISSITSIVGTPKTKTGRSNTSDKKQKTQATDKETIAKKLKILQGQRLRVERDLGIAESAMDEVRDRFGITDLEERSYPHPITARLTRLQKEQDDCVLEISQHKASIENLERQKRDSNAPSEELKEAEADFIVLHEKLKELEKMVDEAKADKKRLDLARSQYQQRVSIRDERRETLNNIKSQIQKLMIMYEEAESSILEK